MLLIVCKGLAYAISLSGFRGGPIFPSMFIGAAGGIALSHVGGLPVVAGAAMGVGAMVAGALKMPMTAVLLPSLLFLSDAVALMPVVIVAVVVSYVVAIWIAPAAKAAQASSASPAPAAAANGSAAFQLVDRPGGDRTVSIRRSCDRLSMSTSGGSSGSAIRVRVVVGDSPPV